MLYTIPVDHQICNTSTMLRLLSTCLYAIIIMDPVHVSDLIP